MAYALEIQDVHKVFNRGTINEKVALNGVNLNLNPGDFVTIIGGNGAGKSTTLNAIAGVWPIDSGKIIIDGTDITNLPEHKRAKYLGRVFQDPMTGTAATMDIEENMAIALRRGEKRTLRWGVSREDRELFREKLQTLGLGLEDRMTSKVGLLSGGQRQAITLLMAALKQPKLLLLDEHTAALDPKTAAKVLEISDKIIAENQLTAMMVTHNMKDAIVHGNRLIMMHEGKVIYDVAGDCPPRHLFADRSSSHLIFLFLLTNDLLLLNPDKSEARNPCREALSCAPDIQGMPTLSCRSTDDHFCHRPGHNRFSLDAFSHCWIHIPCPYMG